MARIVVSSRGAFGFSVRFQDVGVDFFFRELAPKISSPCSRLAAADIGGYGSSFIDRFNNHLIQLVDLRP
jgi:hypothetical protein